MTQKNNLVKQAKERWTSETPLFWKKIMSLAIKIGTAAVAVIGADKMFDLLSTYGVSPEIFTVCGYIVVFCAAVGLSAKITKKNNNDEP